MKKPLWEVAIKLSIGKLKYNGGVKAFFEDVQLNGFTLLDIEESHIDLVEKLDYHHRDPFDRLLIATAEVEGMTFISADENVSKYNAKWLW
jgi:PIN domain nuclease of toxin-antitoxin system